MKILGISALYHDSGAAIIDNGEIIAAAQEERFTRKKHDLSLPVNAAQYCLKTAGVTIDEIDAVVYYDNPLLTLDRFINNAVSLGSNSRVLIDKTFMSMFGLKLWVAERLKEKLGGLGKLGKLLTTEHHISHAASAFYPSPFEEAVIITVDGVGEWNSTTIGIGRGNEILLEKKIDYPHSIGMLYSAFTYFCGFKVNSGDYKLMGLAPYGEPIYYNLIKEKLIDIKNDGSYRLNLEYFNFQCGLTMTNDKFAKLFGGPKREAESQITKREMDMAASVQLIVEEIIVLMAKHAKEMYPHVNNLVMAGGVALNCVANGKLYHEKVFDNIWVQPAAGDAGGALGCALYAAYTYFKIPRVLSNKDSQKGSYLGPSFSIKYIAECMQKRNAVFSQYQNEAELFEWIAEKLDEGMVIGVLQGRMEFGPRALGSRSIIGDPRSEEMQSKLNLKIKYRESFRPFAPSVLKERVSDYFEYDAESPYMLMVAPVNRERRVQFNLEEAMREKKGNLLPIVNSKRSDIPAVTHVDYSARIQTVDEERNPYYYKLIKAFEKKTGCGVIVNTSFNVRGEPIVCTPDEAYECFMRTEMDYLVMENIVLDKKKQTAWSEAEDWREKFALD
mgnify:CR=1 FL=1